MMLKSKKAKRIIGAVCFTLILALMFQLISYVTRDKYGAENSYMYYREEPNTLDVVFVGSSHLMCGVYPMDLYKDFGIASYNFTSSALVTAQSYYQVIEALKTQSPEVLVLDVSGVKYDVKVGSPEFVHTQLDNMPWSMNKINAINDLIESPPDRLEYYIPLIKFHTRWKSLHRADLRPISDTAKGAHVVDGLIEDPEPVELLPQDTVRELPAVAEEYLRRTLDYCRERGVKVLLINTPVTGREPQEYYNSVYAIAEEYGVPYLNMMCCIEEMGFDFPTDMRDHVHCNIKGAQKVTKYVGEYLKGHYSLPDRREDSGYAPEWDRAYEEYKAEYTYYSKHT